MPGDCRPLKYTTYALQKYTAYVRHRDLYVSCIEKNKFHLYSKNTQRDDFTAVIPFITSACAVS